MSSLFRFPARLLYITLSSGLLHADPEAATSTAALKDPFQAGVVKVSEDGLELFGKYRFESDGDLFALYDKDSRQIIPAGVVFSAIRKNYAIGYYEGRIRITEGVKSEDLKKIFFSLTTDGIQFGRPSEKDPRSMGTEISGNVFFEDGPSIEARPSTPIVLHRRKLPPVGTILTTKDVSQISGKLIPIADDVSPKDSIAYNLLRNYEWEVLGPDQVRLEITDLLEQVNPGSVAARGETSLKKTPLIFSRADGVWTPKLEQGSEPSDDQKANLETFDAGAVFENDAAGFETETRRPGDKWELDARRYGKFAGVAGNPRGTIQAEFVKVSTMSDIECAEIHVIYELHSDLGYGGPQRAKGDGTIYHSLKDGIDLDQAFTSDMEFTTLGYATFAGKFQQRIATTVSHR